MKKFVDVIVPLPIANQYTYSLPQEMEEMVQIGCRVVVPFGKKKFYTAIVTNVHYAAPEGYETKDIADRPCGNDKYEGKSQEPEGLEILQIKI